MFCKNCGANVGESKFCPYCGTPVNGAPRSTAPMVATTVESAVPEKSVGIFKAYGMMFKNYSNFSGRSRRSEYWGAAVANFLIMLVAGFLAFFMFYDHMVAIAPYLEYTDDFSTVMRLIQPLMWYFVIFILYAIILIIPSISMTVRRLHDTGKSGWYYLLSFIPYVGSIIILVLTLLDSTPGPNKYGPNPKGVN